MEYRNSFERINHITNIEEISKQIIKHYGFSDYVGYQLIEVGYEDFNYVLITRTKKYVVKIMNTERAEWSSKRLIHILKKSIEEGIPIPNLYEVNQEALWKINIQDTWLTLLVMDYISEKNLWQLNRRLTKRDMQQIAAIASKINHTDYQLESTFYDEWTVTNLKQEYNKKKESLLGSEQKDIKDIVEEFSQVPIDSLPKCYIHGDIIRANLLLDDQEKMYIIDFSVLNYLPRIIEVAVILLGTCLTDQKEESMQNFQYFLKQYHHYNPLDEKELKYLPIIIKALAAMYIIQTRYIQAQGEDYVENDYWLTEGKKYLEMQLSDDDIIPKMF